MPMKTGLFPALPTLTLSVLCLASACATPAQPSRAEQQGDLYFKRGAFHLALPHYEQAASGEPENERVHARLEETREALFKQRLQLFNLVQWLISVGYLLFGLSLKYPEWFDEKMCCCEH